MEAGKDGTIKERGSRPKNFLRPRERVELEAAIALAERETTGEIRVILARKAHKDVLAQAREIFLRHGMHKTRRRNAVLIFLAVAGHRFAILGDEGVHAVMGQEGWNSVRDGMAEHFARDDFARGLVWAVGRVGDILKKYFPGRGDDINELSDGVVEE